MTKRVLGGRPRHGSLLRIMESFGKEPPRMDFEISVKEYSAIGFATVHWAFLEYALHLQTAQMAKRAKIPTPSSATDPSFSRRLTALRRLIEQTVKHKPTKQKWLKRVSRISCLAGQRHKLIHALWSYDAVKPEKLWAIDRRSAKSRSEPFDPEKIARFGFAVGALSFELMFPRGLRDAVNPSMPYMSRSAQLMFTGKPPLDHDLFEALAQNPILSAFSSRESHRRDKD